MKKVVLAAYCTFLCILFSWASPFQPGSIVVVRIGTGNSALVAGTGQAVFLDEYTACGTLVQSIALPVAVNGSNKRCTLPISLSDYSDGAISLSPNGQSLALGGYNADTGTAAVSSTSSTAVSRTVAIVDATGTVNTSTALTAFSANVIRSAVVSGSDIWVTGSSNGILHTTIGSTITNTLTTTTGRSLSIYGSQLYATSAASGIRLGAVGSGMPVTGTQTFATLPGYPINGNTYQFFMADLNATVAGPDVLYVADNNIIVKYSLVSGTWVSNGSIGVANNDKYRGLTGRVDGANVVLFATRRNDNTQKNGGEIITLTDNTGYNASFAALRPVIIAQASENTVMKGIALAPQAPLLLASSGTMLRLLRSQDTYALFGWNGNTETEQYVVERSTDGIRYQTIETIRVASRQNSQPAAYQIKDNNPASGKTFYRLQLKQTANIVYSNTVLVQRESKKQLQAFYNQQGLQLSATGLIPGTYTVAVFTPSGRLSHRSVVQVLNAGLTATIVFQQVPASGIYSVVLQSAESRLQQRFAVIR